MDVISIHKEYKLKGKKLKKYICILLIIFLTCIGTYAKASIELNKLAQKYIELGFNPKEPLESADVTQEISYKIESKPYENALLASLACLIITIIFYHFNFFTKAKISANNRGIQIYSIYSKKPTISLSWEEIDYIDFGKNNRGLLKRDRYGMTIESYKYNYNFEKFINITRFENYKELINEVNKFARKKGITIYNSDEINGGKSYGFKH